MRNRLLWVVAALVLVLIGWKCAFGASYTGNCGIWATRSGDFTSKNFAGTQAGLDSACNYSRAIGRGTVRVFNGCGLTLIPNMALVGDSTIVIIEQAGVIRTYSHNPGFVWELAEVSTNSANWVGPSILLAPNSQIKWREFNTPFTARPWMAKDVNDVATIGCAGIGPIVIQPLNVPILRATSTGVRIGDNQAPAAVLDVNGAAIFRGPVSAGTPPTLADNTTPSVAAGNVFKCTPAGSTTITNFSGGIAGQIITVIFTNANASITDGGNFRLNGSFSPSSADDVMRLVFDGTTWFEISRSQN